MPSFEDSIKKVLSVDEYGDTAAVAMDTTLKDGSQKAQISNGSIEAEIETDNDALDLDGKKGLVALAIMYARTASGAVHRLAADFSTWALVVVDYVHHEIHSGSHYYIQGFVELNDTDTFYVKLTTPNTTKWSHFIFDIKSTGICSSTLDEEATGGMTGGVAIVPINNNRNLLNTSGMTITSNVTACTSYTTRLENDKWGANGFKETIGGGSGREDELILKQGTDYCRSFTSGADNNIIQFKASWYEHTNKT